jgi:hypothetical protein
MGAWGEKGTDNDTAQDWLDDISGLINSVLRHAFWSRFQEEGIAAAQILSELPNELQARLGVHVFSDALAIVEDELDPALLQAWKAPKKRQNYLRGLRAALLRRHRRFPKQPRPVIRRAHLVHRLVKLKGNRIYKLSTIGKK